jgi:hypothetical protein
MKTVNNSTRYENGARIVEQTATYTQSDDILQLAQYQSQLGGIVRRIEDLQVEGSSTVMTVDLSRLSTERSKFEQLIVEQQAIVNGYNA